MLTPTQKEVNIGTEEAPMFIDATVYRLFIEKPDDLFRSIAIGSTNYTDKQLDAMLKITQTQKSSHA